MRYPSKVTPFSKSTLALFPVVLAELEKGDFTPKELYFKVRRKVGSIEEYLDILDALYALRKIAKLPEGLLHYVE